MVLLGDVFEELCSLNEVLWRRLTRADWFSTTMKQILLGQLQKKVCTQSDVEVDIALRSLSLGDMQVQSLVEKLDGLFFVLLLSPSDDSFKVSMVGGLLIWILADLDEEFKLLSSILKLILFDLAVDHTVQRSLIRLIEGGGFLVDSVGGGILTKHAFLMGYLRMIVGVLGLQSYSLLEHQESLRKDGVSSSTVSSKQSRHVVE